MLYSSGSGCRNRRARIDSDPEVSRTHNHFTPKLLNFPGAVMLPFQSIDLQESIQ